MRGTWRFGFVALAAVALWALAPAEVAAIDGPHAAFAQQGCNGCHVPHAASGGTLLLWNRTFSTKDFFWSDATATTGGTPLPTKTTNPIKTWTGTTKNCLSCHDGSVTSDPFGSQISGGDLKGSHPVAVPFPIGGKANTYNGITTYGLTAGTTVSGFVLTPSKVKIFTDAAAAATAPNNRGIECASCHDPHDHATYGKYLRDTQTGGQICLDCHVK